MGLHFRGVLNTCNLAFAGFTTGKETNRRSTRRQGRMDVDDQFYFCRPLGSEAVDSLRWKGWVSAFLFLARAFPWFRGFSALPFVRFFPSGGGGPGHQSFRLADPAL